ncbi:MAG: histidine kinase [Cyanobacteria bacterium]|nr:histidine kinase [Cyanobacteriota bacterium]MDW8200488.1 histidine kinase [Cyanobacteriota bacterium SKYGB_h_bin112]
MQAFSDPTLNSAPILQLLVFVDKRPSSGEQIRYIQECLSSYQIDRGVDLQVIDVVEKPYLAEHFKLVATPSLIKVYPEPRQVLAGSDLVVQLEKWLPRWQRAVEAQITKALISSDRDTLPPAPMVGADQATTGSGLSQPHPTSYLAELIRLSEEVFQLKQEKEELLAQVTFKDRIIAMLAHDLRNPLTATSIALETLEMGTQSEAAGESKLTLAMTAQLLRHARTQTKAIDRMITDLLQAAQGNQTDLRIQAQELDLGALCRDVLAQWSDRIHAKSQRLEVDIPSDLPTVYADPERLRQVIVNLLDNAVKYTPEQGTIQVSILHRTTQKIQVSVCDDGPGIPEDNREKIFEERFRLQRDEVKEGYGIGLALCRRIIRAHYGQIWVDSVTGRGSCFHFTLPVYRL